VGCLIDTSVFVAWEREQLDPSALLTKRAHEAVALSAITASELLHGVHRASTPAQRAKREAFVEALLAALPIFGFDLDVARVHARLWSDLRSRGEMIGAHDLLIAATAISHGCIVATRNVREFARVADLQVEIW
jgi:tRNA(fMet)-specific endonuclease VapC